MQDELISRQAVLDLPRLKSFNAWGDVIYESVDVEDIRQLPSVKPQEKTGHWIITSMSNMAYCSECDYLFRDVSASIVKHFKFCPNCGAKMQTEGNIKQGLNYADEDTLMSAT